MIKICSRCNKEKDAEEFYRHSKAWDGYQSCCKVCDKKASGKSYRKNLDVNREKRKKWQEENYELHLEHNRKYQNKKYYKKLKEQAINE